MEPLIVGFLCKWCGYAGADSAGLSRYVYPSNIRIIRVMCSGTVKPEWIIHALTHGADGVLVVGCHEGDCHYVNGNVKAKEMVEKLRKILSLIGIDERRVKFECVSASEGARFAKIVKEFTEEIRSLGKLTFR